MTTAIPTEATRNEILKNAQILIDDCQSGEPAVVEARTRIFNASLILEVWTEPSYVAYIELKRIALDFKGTATYEEIRTLRKDWEAKVLHPAGEAVRCIKYGAPFSR